MSGEYDFYSFKISASLSVVKLALIALITFTSSLIFVSHSIAQMSTKEMSKIVSAKDFTGGTHLSRCKYKINECICCEWMRKIDAHLKKWWTLS